MNVERYSDILEKEKNQLISNESGLSDFSEGSVIMTMLETFARRIEQLYVDTRNGFNTNLKAIAYNIFDFKKKEGNKAAGTVKFYRAKALSIDTVIPAGTEVKAGDLTYNTTEEGHIRIGALESSDISIVASDIGELYNVDVGEVKTISSILTSDVIRVSNSSKITGGIDSETDSETFKRFIEFVNGLDGNNIYALKAALRAIPGINDISIIEHFPPDETGNNFTLYVNAGGEGLSSDLQTKIKKTVDGDGTKEYPGHKSTGIQWNLESVRYFPVKVTYWANCELSDQSSVSTQMKEVIENAINNLRIGQEVVISDLLAKLKSLSFVKDCGIVSPTQNVYIEPGYTAHADTIVRVGEED